MRLAEIASLPKFDDTAMKAARKIKPLVLDQPQKNALTWYKDGGYTPINTTLRGGPEKDREVDDAQMHTDYGFAMTVDDAVRHLSDATGTGPRRKKPLNVFRGERNRARAQALGDMEVGQSYVEPTFVSTSLGPSYAYYAFTSMSGTNIVSMIVVPPDVRGAYISNAHDPETHTEMEFLIDRGTRFTLAEKRTIPNRNKGHPVKDIVLLVFNASPGGA